MPPRPKGSQNIKGWREHELLRDLALNEEGVESLAEKYEVQPQAIYDFRWRRKGDIAHVLADWANEFSDLHSVKKHNRVAELEYLKRTLYERLGELEADAVTATETMRRVDPEATAVRVPLREWRATVRDIARLEHQIAEEMGQLAQHIGGLLPEVPASQRLRLLGLTNNVKTKPGQAPVYGPQAGEPEPGPVDVAPLSRLPVVAELEQKLAFAEAYIAEQDSWQGKVIEGFQRQLAVDDQLRGEVAEQLAPDWYTEDPSLTGAERIEKFRQQLELDDRHRFDVAELIALDWYGEGRPMAFVDDPEAGKDAEPVDVFRAMPGPPPDVENEPVEPVEVIVDEAVDEPGELEVPAVAPEVERAARRLAEQVWGLGVVPHADLYSGVSAHWVDQYLAYAVGMNWLVSDAESQNVRRGEVDPRPVSVTRIPNF